MSAVELALLGHLLGDGCTLPRHTIQSTTNDPGFDVLPWTGSNVPVAWLKYNTDGSAAGTPFG